VASDNRRTLDLADGDTPLHALQRVRRNTCARFGVEYFTGFESAVPLRQEVIMRGLVDGPTLVDDCERLSIRWLIVDRPHRHSRLRLAAEDAGALLYEVTGARPLAYADEAAATLEVLSPTRLRATVVLPAPGRLVVAYAWYPGWTATSAGQELEVELAEELFMAVRLPAGAHMVEYAFDDPDLDLGARVSLASWGLWVVATALVRRRGRAPEACTATPPGARS
jgi:hypothetical protein